MPVNQQHKKSKCPGCGSKDLFTLGLDQFCCDCDWSNSVLLVQLGHMDRIATAAIQQFEKPIAFEDLPPSEEALERANRTRQSAHYKGGQRVG